MYQIFCFAGDEILMKDGQATSLDLKSIEHSTTDTPTNAAKLRGKRKENFRQPQTKRKRRGRPRKQKKSEDTNPEDEIDDNETKSMGEESGVLDTVNVVEKSDAKFQREMDINCEGSAFNHEKTEISGKTDENDEHVEVQDKIRTELESQKILSDEGDQSNDKPDSNEEEEQEDQEAKELNEEESIGKNPDEMRYHISIPSSLKHHCGICDKTFLLKSSMVSHIRRTHFLTLPQYEAAIESGQFSAKASKTINITFDQLSLSTDVIMYCLL